MHHLCRIPATSDSSFVSWQLAVNEEKEEEKEADIFRVLKEESLSENGKYT